MNGNQAAKNRKHFLIKWSILNLLGWMLGWVFMSLNLFNIEYMNKYSALETMLIWLPLGIGVGVFQWFILRQLGINFFVWVFVTALGFGLLGALYFWVYNFSSFEYRMKYAIPYPIINIGLMLTLPVGGAIIGSFQSLAIRKRILKLDQWIKAYVFGFLLPSIIAPFSMWSKSFFFNLLRSFDLYILVDLRWLIFFGFLLIVTSTSVSILTGKILFSQSNINSMTMNPI